MTLPTFDADKVAGAIEDYTDHFHTTEDVWSDVDAQPTSDLLAAYEQEAAACPDDVGTFYEWLEEAGYVVWNDDPAYLCKRFDVTAVISQMYERIERSEWSAQMDDYHRMTLESYR